MRTICPWTVRGMKNVMFLQELELLIMRNEAPLGRQLPTRTAVTVVALFG